MKLWAKFINIVSVLLLIGTGVMAIVFIHSARGTDSSSITLSGKQARDQYFTISTTSGTTTQWAFTGPATIQCPSGENRVMTAVREENPASNYVPYINCYDVGTGSYTDSWGFAHYYPYCITRPTRINYRVIDTMAITCATTSLRWQNPGENQ